MLFVLTRSVKEVFDVNHQFSMIPAVEIPRSKFNRTHTYKTAFDAGRIVPFYVDEVLPGDTFNVDSTLFARLATPAVPILDNIYLDTFFFFVPSRLLWNHWEEMNGQRINPEDSTDYLVPQITAPDKTGFALNSLADYFGIPTGVPGIKVSALPFRAYALIWNEWFRDENLQEQISFALGDIVPKEDIAIATGQPFHRGKRHDYFTSCLPWPQKGPGVELPLSGNAPVVPADGAAADKLFKYKDSGTLVSTAIANNLETPQPIEDKGVYVSNMIADLSDVSAATINSLRQAFAIQRLYERDARGGSRYTEILQSHFGVISPDARLQRPEYLGGRSQPITINPVIQTSAAADQPTPQGNLAAYGVCGSKKNGFNKSFTEHGYVFGFVNVRADISYDQGLNRMWSRESRFDFYWPALSHLGEQAVFNKEIYAQGNADDDKAFGFQERWSEYRYYPNQITGAMRSTAPQSLDVWHCGEHFADLPKLNGAFIEDDSYDRIKRSIAVQSEPQFLMDVYVIETCARPMPVYSTPGLIDHF